MVRRQVPDSAFFIGSGKVDELKQRFLLEPVGTVVFDNILSPIQQRNLFKAWSVHVLDRTDLILEIFAKRAKSYEGKLQVELAQLEHLSARLVRGWSHLERQRGGIGMRGGPGEKQIELDRRMLGIRVKRLRAQLEQLKKQRRTRRQARERYGRFNISLIGYTNAGKSTLFNSITGAKAYAANQLFATLDTLTRKMWLPSGREVIVSDTVGFIRDLPHQLIDAFSATLEETVDSDLLLHVVDANAPNLANQISEVSQVLERIGAASVPRVLVYNKIDLMTPQELSKILQDKYCYDDADKIIIPHVTVSAVTKSGLDDLELIIKRYSENFLTAN